MELAEAGPRRRDRQNIQGKGWMCGGRGWVREKDENTKTSKLMAVVPQQLGRSSPVFFSPSSPAYKILQSLTPNVQEITLLNAYAQHTLPTSSYVCNFARYDLMLRWAWAWRWSSGSKGKITKTGAE
jgi:hypothetical protein